MRKILLLINLSILNIIIAYADNQNFEQYEATSTQQTTLYDQELGATPVANKDQWYLYDQKFIPGSIISQTGDSFIVKNQFVPYSGKDKDGKKIVVAVIDTGYVPHPDFISTLIQTGINKNGIPQYGYDFIIDCRAAGIDSPAGCAMNTSDSAAKRTPQLGAIDVGNFTTPEDCNALKNSKYSKNCIPGQKSSWHGTSMIGLITGQGAGGLLGGAYNSRILPIRIDGKFGINGLVAGVYGILYAVDDRTKFPDIIPKNTTPARVLNYSIGALRLCNNELQEFTDIVNSKGAMLVAATDNFPGGDVSTMWPANCKGVISVAAATDQNKLVDHSGYGNVTITASGGDNNNNLVTDSYSSLGAFDPNCLNCYNTAKQNGTSIATALTSAAVADILSANPRFNNIDVINALKISASPLANNCYSNDETKCVPNRRLNVHNAVDYAADTAMKDTAAWKVAASKDIQGLAEAKTLTYSKNKTYIVTIESTANSYYNIVLYDLYDNLLRENGLILEESTPIKDLNVAVSNDDNLLYITYIYTKTNTLNLATYTPITRDYFRVKTNIQGKNQHIVAARDDNLPEKLNGIYWAFQNLAQENKDKITVLRAYITKDNLLDIKPVGNNGSQEINNSALTVGDFSLTTDKKNGTPFVAYMNTDFKPCVDSYDKDKKTWYQVDNSRPIKVYNWNGSKEDTASATTNTLNINPALAFDDKNNAYLAYTSNESGSCKGCLKVVRHDLKTNRWLEVGSEGSESPTMTFATQPSIAFATSQNQKKSYIDVSYRDKNNSGQIVRYDGLGWQSTRGFTLYKHLIYNNSAKDLIYLPGKPGFAKQQTLFIHKFSSQLPSIPELYLMERDVQIN